MTISIGTRVQFMPDQQTSELLYGDVVEIVGQVAHSEFLILKLRVPRTVGDEENNRIETVGIENGVYQDGSADVIEGDVRRWRTMPE